MSAPVLGSFRFIDRDTRDRVDELSRGVPCPMCGVPVGARCRAVSGDLALSHVARRREAGFPIRPPGLAQADEETRQRVASMGARALSEPGRAPRTRFTPETSRAALEARRAKKAARNGSVDRGEGKQHEREVVG